VGVVNNAGIGGARWPLELAKLTDARKMFNTNYWGTISLTQKFLPLIRRDQGRVVFISSVAGFLTAPGTSIYSGTKHAMEAAADALRLEMEDFGVSVSVVEPGFINTSVFVTADIPVDVEVDPELGKLCKKFRDGLKQDKQMILDAPPPSVTTQAIRHALTDSYPRTRYLVGATGVPITAYAVSLLVSILPDRLLDLLIGQY